MIVSNTSDPTEIQIKILRELRHGATDTAIARRLQISERQVRAQIARLAAITNTQGRFALGVEAARRGWLTS